MTETPTFTDVNPERDFANSERLGFILKLTGRQVRRLAADGILPREPDGTFHINRCVNAFIEYKTAPPPAARANLDRRRAEVIQRRLERADQEEISMEEALETLDMTTGAFMKALSLVEAETVGPAEDPARVRLAIAQTRATLVDRFGGHRLDLVKGRRK